MSDIGKNYPEYIESKLMEFVEQEFQRHFLTNAETIYKTGEKLMNETNPNKKKELEDFGKNEEEGAELLVKLRKEFQERGEYQKLWKETDDLDVLKETVSDIFVNYNSNWPSRDDLGLEYK